MRFFPVGLTFLLLVGCQSGPELRQSDINLKKRAQLEGLFSEAVNAFQEENFDGAIEYTKQIRELASDKNPIARDAQYLAVKAHCRKAALREGTKLSGDACRVDQRAVSPSRQNLLRFISDLENSEPSFAP